MKKILSVFVALAFVAPVVALGAVSVKKSSSVKKNTESSIDSATSLLPTVISLVGNVKGLNAQQQQLVADCVPTSDEIRVVNDLVKEWAKIGDVDATGAIVGLGDPCNSELSEIRSDDGSYARFMEIADNNEVCFERFVGASNKEMIWFGYPKASSAKVCDPVTNKDCKTVSNIYEIFEKIPFSTQDYTKAEAAKVAKLVAKSEKCAPSKINAAKRELWGGFLTQTLSGVGKTSGASGTDAVIQAVSSAGGGGLQSMLPSLGQMATQVLDK